MARVAIVQRLITHYRVEFYNKLDAKLAEIGIELAVFGGSASGHLKFKDGLDDVRCGVRVSNRNLGSKLYWQPIVRRLRGYDLVIVEQANSALINYPLIVLRKLTGRPGRFAIWGHGANLNIDESSAIKAWVRTLLTRSADHWFAYTSVSRKHFVAAGTKANALTVVNNSIDTSDLAGAADAAARAGKAALRARLGLGVGPIAVFCSRLYAGKRLEFAIEACKKVRVAIPSLELVVIGDGPDKDQLLPMFASNPWIRYQGALYGQAKAAMLVAGDILVLPSAVGVSILDGYAAGLPCMTADFENHGPETAYLEPGVTGMMTAADPASYAESLLAVLSDPDRLARMSAAARAASRQFSLSAMVDNFAAGVQAALTA